MPLMPSLKYEGFNGYPGVREGQKPSDLILDPIQYLPYRTTYLEVSDRLEIGTPIPDDIGVSFLGNNTLLEGSFSLRDLDRRPIETVTIPGKSAHISHTENAAVAVLTMLSRKGKREDHLYTVPAGLLRTAGFSAIYAPTGKKLLHLRVVPDRYDGNGDIPEEYRVRLVGLLQAHKVSKAA